MRKGASTVVSVVGELKAGLLAGAARSHNVALAGDRGGDLDVAVEALRRAGGLSSPYVVLAADPLAETSAQWTEMWQPGSPAHDFGTAADRALAAWRSGRFELPDYYVVVTRLLDPHRRDFHLGWLKSQRPGRVLPLVAGETLEGDVAALVGALSRLPQGPWWPPLDRLLEGARRYYPETVAPGGAGPS